MRIENFTFGSIVVDGISYDYDLVIDRGKVSKRKKKPSKAFKAEYGHTPLSAAGSDEKIHLHGHAVL